MLPGHPFNRSCFMLSKVETTSYDSGTRVACMTDRYLLRKVWQPFCTVGKHGKHVNYTPLLRFIGAGESDKGFQSF